MTGQDTLLTLAKGKLNITWDDTGTNARLEAILNDAIPVVCNMVGLVYSYTVQEALDEEGEVFDFSAPSMERNVLLNYISYEWNHRTDIFRSAYWQEIAACRQRHELLAAEAANSTEEAEDSTEETEDNDEDSTEDADGTDDSE
ncbi:MAG: hypothetical protein LUE24_13940 [Lachnospiraceae bacterium]|nr:hypothetical protein [Lachnospiraceae bacterium]